MISRQQLSDFDGRVPKDKPSLALIAEMPLPLSMLTMRRHYHKDWHRPESDGESLGKWRIEFSYSYTETNTWDCDIAAVTEDEARKLAEVQFNAAHKWPECDIQTIEAQFVEEAP